MSAVIVKQTLCGLRTLILWPYLIEVDELSAGSELENLPRGFKSEYKCTQMLMVHKSYCVELEKWISESWLE